MKAHYQKLLDYNFWANSQLLSCFQNSTVVNNKVFLLFSHILTAEEIWLCRAKGEKAPTQRLWQMYGNERLEQMLEENQGQWHSYFKDIGEKSLDQAIDYQNTKGEEFSASLSDMITHMVNHGTHHRAQIINMLQLEKIQAPASDYIVFLRMEHAATGSRV